MHTPPTPPTFHFWNFYWGQKNGSPTHGAEEQF